MGLNSSDGCKIFTPSAPRTKSKSTYLKHLVWSPKIVTGFVNLTVHDSDTNTVGNMQNIGLVYKGAFDARPKDEIALGLARISMNDDLNTNHNEEYDAEIYYGIHATNWLTVRPNIQYIRHVGAYKNGENAWVGGIKLQTAF